MKYAAVAFLALIFIVGIMLPARSQQATAGSLGSQGASLSVIATGFSTCAVQLSGTWAGTVTFQAGGNAVQGYDFTGHNVGMGTSTDGMYYWASGGAASCAVTMTSYSSGTASVQALLASTGVTFSPPGVAYVVPSDGCTATGTTFETLSCPGDPNVTIVAPTDNAHNVNVNCQVGCSGGGGGNTTIVAPTDASGNVKVVCEESSCSGGGGGGNVTIVAPTNGAGQVIVTTPAPVATVFIANTPGFVCISGCTGSAPATIPPELSTSSPLPVATSLPVIGQNYWWNGTGWIAVTSSSPLPVTTPAPVATVFIVNTPAVNQGTNPWTVNTAAPCATPTCNSVVWQGTSPWVVSTPYNSPQPLPTASAGVAPTAAAGYPQVAAINVCAMPLGGLPVVTPGNLITQMCSTSGFPEVTLCGATSGNCVGVNGANGLQTVCSATAYPCGFPTPLPVPSPVLPTASPGAAYPVTAQQTQAILDCASDQSTGTSISAGQYHVLECEKHGVIAQGLCTSTLPCSPAIGDTTISAAVTTGTAQIIAAPAAGVAIHVTAIQALGEESATGGVMDLIEGTGTNCTSITATIPVLALGAAFTANQQIEWGNGVGTVLLVPTATELCTKITAGTVTTANMVITYTEY